MSEADHQLLGMLMNYKGFAPLDILMEGLKITFDAYLPTDQEKKLRMSA